VLAFLLLALSAFPAKAGGPSGARRALGLCGLVALGSEALQAASDTRSPAVTDVAVNLLAALVGVRLLFVPPSFLGPLATWSEGLTAGIRPRRSLPAFDGRRLHRATPAGGGTTQ